MTMGQRLAILGALAFLALLGQTLLSQGTAGPARSSPIPGARSPLRTFT